MFVYVTRSHGGYTWVLQLLNVPFGYISLVIKVSSFKVLLSSCVIVSAILNFHNAADFLCDIFFNFRTAHNIPYIKVICFLVLLLLFFQTHLIFLSICSVVIKKESVFFYVYGRMGPKSKAKSGEEGGQTRERKTAHREGRTSAREGKTSAKEGRTSARDGKSPKKMTTAERLAKMVPYTPFTQDQVG